MAANEFVRAYVNDILVFSPILHENFEHQLKLIDPQWEVHLKLNPLKCKFVREEAGYLGHVIKAQCPIHRCGAEVTSA